MASRSPLPLSSSQRQSRLDRVARIAQQLGFEGAVEYRHVYSSVGGAQYGRAATIEGDLLIVYAEAFERDAIPDEFSLTAIIAHERGHQLLARHPRIAKQVEGKISETGEEILASILGAILCGETADNENLMAKAAVPMIEAGENARSGCAAGIGLEKNIRGNVMMGNKTLGEIREELRDALAATGEDPIEWLDKRIAAAESQGADSRVLLALKHVLERGPKKSSGQGGTLAPNGKPTLGGKRPDVLAELDAVTRALQQATAKKPRPRKTKAKA